MKKEENYCTSKKFKSIIMYRGLHINSLSYERIKFILFIETYANGEKVFRIRTFVENEYWKPPFDYSELVFGEINEDGIDKQIKERDSIEYEEFNNLRNLWRNCNGKSLIDISEENLSIINENMDAKCIEIDYFYQINN